MGGRADYCSGPENRHGCAPTEVRILSHPPISIIPDSSRSGSKALPSSRADTFPRHFRAVYWLMRRSSIWDLCATGQAVRTLVARVNQNLSSEWRSILFPRARPSLVAIGRGGANLAADPHPWCDVIRGRCCLSIVDLQPVAGSPVEGESEPSGDVVIGTRRSYLPPRPHQPVCEFAVYVYRHV